MSLGWELSVSTQGGTVNYNMPVPKICIALREIVQGKFDLRLIFIVFYRNEGIFAGKVKFTVFTVKSLFPS